MAGEKNLNASPGVQMGFWTQDVRVVALITEVSLAVMTGVGVAWWYGTLPALRYLLGLLLALGIQVVFLTAMRRKIGRERSTLADVLTVGRATVGALLAGLVASGIQDRSGVAGWFAWSATLLAATVLDWCDGPLARRLGPTRLGKVMDIEADSWLTLWSVAGAVAWGGLPWWCVLAPLAHYGRPIIALRRGELPSGGDPWWGRVTGGAQMLLVFGALAPIHDHLRDIVLSWAALPVSGSQLLVMLALICRGAGRVVKPMNSATPR
jgi:phosphatidylglycerophosphate synthase